ncbi:hypothetical protein [Micromonospora arida]
MTVTLVTGANKDIGFATASQLVQLGSRRLHRGTDAQQGAQAAAVLGARFLPLDVTDDASALSALPTID